MTESDCTSASVVAVRMDRKSSDDDGYNLSYERQESTEKLVQRLEQQNKDHQLRLRSLTTILKVGLVTIIILVLIVLGCLSALLVNASGKADNIMVAPGVQTLNLNGSNECQFLMNGNVTKSLMLTDTDKLYTIKLVGPGACQVRVLVVGGGGYSSYGGGGSGEVLYDTIQLNPN